MDTLTKAKIVEKLHESIGLSKSESLEFLEFFLNEISKKLKNKEEVRIANFGTFKLRSKSERVGRNPKTMKEHIISERSVISFKASNNLVQKINKNILNEE